MKENTHCVINDSTKFSYCGKSDGDFYFSSIEDALLVTYQSKDIRLCFECWEEILKIDG